GHDAIDRNLLDSRHAVARRHDGDHRLRVALQVGKDALDRWRGRRNDRQTVRPVALVAKLDRGFEIRRFNVFGGESDWHCPNRSYIGTTFLFENISSYRFGQATPPQRGRL